jgi:tRNA A37 threonylcarbamoyladenosine biosynthesis protein TsaE
MELIEILEKRELGDPEKLNFIKRKIKKGQKIDSVSKKYLLKNYESIEDLHGKYDPSIKETPNSIKKILSPIGKLKIFRKLKKKSPKQQRRPSNQYTANVNNSAQNMASGYNSGKKIIPQTVIEKEKITLKKNKPQGNQSILLDEYEKHPTQNFESLSKTVSDIIKNSPPNFTLGVYGEWGIGKTTLMKAIDANLNEEVSSKDDSPILTIWFNAWKFERDQSPITHSLMKSMAFEMEGHKIFNTVAKEIFSAIKIFDENAQSSQLPQFNVQNPDELKKDRLEQSKQHEKIQKESIYYSGISKIQNALAQIRSERGNEFRVVIFIDDLDRCSPDKTIELLESIKMLLEVEGFIFIVALSYDSVTRLITNAYKNTGIKGEDYLKKIIQLPVTIPPWSRENFLELISQKIAPKLNEEYSKFVLENPGILSQVSNSNPRQLKRFINNVIIGFETFSKDVYSKITLDEIFLVKILKSEWPEFYQEIIKNEEFRIILSWLITRPKEMKKYFNYLESPEQEDLLEQKQKRYSILVKTLGSKTGILRNSQIKTLVDFDNTTWMFFENIKKIMFGIKDWKLIDSVTGIIEDIPYGVSLKQKEHEVPRFQQP